MQEGTRDKRNRGQEIIQSGDKRYEQEGTWEI